MKRYAVIVHAALKDSGINFVAYLPDDQIHDAQKLIAEDKDFTTVGHSRSPVAPPVTNWSHPEDDAFRSNRIDLINGMALTGGYVVVNMAKP
jgi:hypothetical protein